MKYIDNVQMEPWHPCQAVIGRMVTTATSPMGRVTEILDVMMDKQDRQQAIKIMVAASYATNAIRKMMEETVE